MKKGEHFAGGLQINFFDSVEFEDEKSAAPSEKIAIKTRNLLRVLMMGWTDDWRELLSWETFNAVFVNRNHDLTKAMRLAFQDGFNHIFSQLKDNNLTEQQLNQAKIYISNCLTFLPFSDMKSYEFFKIPQWVDNQWQMIDYHVTPIELTPTTGFKKLFIHDHDRVYAYGLEPIHHATAEPHLIFMGTTYPAGQGFATTVNTDLEAFETAGKKLYRSGHKAITNWLDKQHPRKTHVCGTSLGGALSLLVAIDQGNKLSRIDALNPPGLYDPLRKSRFDHWDELTEKPEVYIQKQEGDPVSRFGVWKPDWHLLHVIPPADKRGPNQVTDHALNYAGFADTQFIGIDTKEDNEERKSRNLWMYTILRSGAYYLGMVPYRYLILPTVRSIVNHSLQLAILLPLVVLFYILPVLSVAVTASLAINALLGATLGSYWLANMIHFATDKTPSSKISPVVLAISLLAISLITASLIFFPTIAPFFMFAVAATPLIYSGLLKLGSHLVTLLGYNDVELPKCQDPALPRNDSLDLYTNTMEATFSYKDLGDYYHVKRCVLKNKDFLPEHSSKLFKTTGLSKREILENSKNPLLHNEKVTFTTTKAKARDIQHTLGLIRSRFGFHKAELQRSHEHYVTGKFTQDKKHNVEENPYTQTRLD